MCPFRNSKIMGCLHMRMRWISCRMKEIGLLKSSNTQAAQQSQYVCLTHIRMWSVWQILYTVKSISLVWLSFFFLNQVLRNAVQSEWQAFLNLCLAQEMHLDNIEDYKKVKHHVLPFHTIPPNLFVYQSFVFFKPVPTWCRDVVRLPEKTQCQSGPKLSEQQDQLWDPAGARGTIVLF